MNWNVCVLGVILLVISVPVMTYKESYVTTDIFGDTQTWSAYIFENPESMPGYFTVYPYANIGSIFAIIGFVVVVIGLIIKTEDSFISH